MASPYPTPVLVSLDRKALIELLRLGGHDVPDNAQITVNDADDYGIACVTDDNPLDVVWSKEQPK
jgi:hypothetical protein